MEGNHSKFQFNAESLIIRYDVIRC